MSRVLVMDDEHLVADSLAEILTLYGYEAQWVYAPEDALQHISSHPCDLLVTDVVIQGHMSGIELAIQLSELLPSCKVLLISGDEAATELLKDAEERGYSFGILPKPCHPQEILDRIRILLTC